LECENRWKCHQTTIFKVNKEAPNTTTIVKIKKFRSFKAISFLGGAMWVVVGVEN
jgi:hypothetical protein